MRRAFWIIAIVLTALAVMGCGGGNSQELIETRLDVKKVEGVKDSNYVMYIADPQTKELRKLFLDHNVCAVRILDDLEKGAPAYADAKYYINNNGPPNAKRVYKEMVIHLHSADEINGNIKKD